MIRAALIVSLGLGALLWGCTPVTPTPIPINENNHPDFPITAGSKHALGAMTVEGALTCDSCHRATAESFSRVRCDGCHRHPQAIAPRLHLGVADFLTRTDPGAATLSPEEQAENRGAGCFSCHPTGEPQFFTHTGITAQCAECHAVDTPFAALPRPNFTHPNVGAADCGGCHVVTTWTGASLTPSGVFDPARNITLSGLQPSFTGPVMARVTPLPQTLTMPMNHLSSAIDAGVLSDCAVCHADSVDGVFFPGNLHSSLAGLLIPQPTQCASCHVESRPVAFVGPLAMRTPATGPMRHDAVGWVDGGPAAPALVTADCATCHQTPDETVASAWSTGRDGGTPLFHASLTLASLAQPASCLDCHANSRPTTQLTSMNSAIPVGMTFDHQTGNALLECAGCHGSTSVWSGGIFHSPSVPTPTTCLSCHAGERPTSTAGWQSTTFMNSPFDYGTNSLGVGHGGGEDCAVCHSSSTSTWRGGSFPHGPGTLATMTCSTCHVSQRPTAIVMGFNHTLNGTGDCRACHQATVSAGRYVSLSDWAGGRSYPGDVLVTSPTNSITIPAWRLTRDPQNFATGLVPQQLTFFNAMLHTSSVIRPEVAPGTSMNGDPASCWHCHTNVDGGVTQYVDGRYHQALMNYSATPGGAVMALPQPTSRCADCHEQMRPNLIVERMASVLQAMDHSATFTAPVTIDGGLVSGVAGLDCSTCHASPGNTWGDGRFHPNIAMASPADCVGCHYPLMATAQADVTSGTTFAMKHRSTQLTVQRCETCHTTALAQSRMLPVAATLWRTGELHRRTPMQPTACLECHASSEPAAATQSTVSWTFANGGGTATNSAQWMSHSVADVTSRDCANCHQADARTMGSAWSRSTNFHARVTVPSTCTNCHGTGNGRGTVVGTNNNLPSGLSNSRTTTTASVWPGVKDQLSHADLNVTARDCRVCHTQLGASTTPGVQGQEWKQAFFHRNFTTSSPLVMNTTTGRCSNCHFNLKPGPTFTTFDHSPFTTTSGSVDCSACHSYPGTSATTPNWLGAAAMPPFIAVGGFTIPQPPATAANVLQTGIANLPHPTVAVGVSCTTCHTTAAGGRRAFGFPHTSTLINSNCNSCHEAGTDLIGTSWNGATTVASGAGDSRPFTLTAVVPSFKGNSRSCASPKHFFPVDCKECHSKPTGNGLVTTGAAYTQAWKFKHSEGSPMTKPATCNLCHNPVASDGCGIPK
ncbi:MAG: hypothetical protein QM817_01060 [Archangium sp.]